jgi:hypothetical protein
VAVVVNEVAVRSDSDGKVFLRYKKDDDKSKAKALRDAKKEAEYLVGLAGLDGSPKVTLLKTK